MKIAVVGLWHLGCVTAACLASGGHEVIGLDPDVNTIENLNKGKPPIFEPGLNDLVEHEIASHRLSFSSDLENGISAVDCVWITMDTPVDEQDIADVDHVRDLCYKVLAAVKNSALILISSQVPVGFTAGLEKEVAQRYPQRNVSFAYLPENLRLGKAISVFTQPDRVVAGVRLEASKVIIQQILNPFTEHIIWMSIESAEMTKHALNAFLATSVCFINEIATLCEEVGADAKEVEKGLKSESRIGPRAYLSPGTAYSGGTLARDIEFLTHLGQEHNHHVHLLNGVKISNTDHQGWIKRKIVTLLGDIHNKKIVVWGLTYKAGTDTLRRSAAIELCKWLIENGASVHGYDALVKNLPESMNVPICIEDNPVSALKNADAVIVATEWQGLASISSGEVIEQMTTPIMIDPNRFLQKTMGFDPDIRYYAIGKAMTQDGRGK